MRRLGMGFSWMIGVPVMLGLGYGAACARNEEDGLRNGEAVLGIRAACGPMSKGAPCGDDGICDGAGVCVSCSDGLMNGDEDGVDCGGSRCASCDGAACSMNAQCARGHCVGGICCNEDCPGECRSCTTGTCVPIPFMNPSGPCSWPVACDGLGACKSVIGASCSSGASCVGGICRGQCPQGYCYDGVACDGGACIGSICVNPQECTSDGDCDAGSCVNGECTH